MVKHQTRFGELEVPDGWTDETVVQFYSPAPPAPPVGDIARPPPAAAQMRGATTLTAVNLPTGGVAAYLAEKEATMKRQVAKFEVLSREPLVRGGDETVPTWLVSYELGPGVAVQQLQSFFASADAARATVLTFVAHRDQFASYRATFDAIFRSLRVA